MSIPFGTQLKNIFRTFDLSLSQSSNLAPFDIGELLELLRSKAGDFWAVLGQVRQLTLALKYYLYYNSILIIEVANASIKRKAR